MKEVSYWSKTFPNSEDQWIFIGLALLGLAFMIWALTIVKINMCIKVSIICAGLFVICLLLWQIPNITLVISIGAFVLSMLFSRFNAIDNFFALEAVCCIVQAFTLVIVMAQGLSTQYPVR